MHVCFQLWFPVQQMVDRNPPAEHYLHGDVCEQHLVLDGDDHRRVRYERGTVLVPRDLRDRGGVHVADDLGAATQLDADRPGRDADLPLDVCNGEKEKHRKEMKI